MIAAFRCRHVEADTVIDQPGVAARVISGERQGQLRCTGMSHSVENTFSQREIQFSFDLLGQVTRMHSAAKIQVKTGSRAKDIELRLESSLQRARLEFSSFLGLSEYVADFEDDCVDFFLDNF